MGSGLRKAEDLTPSPTSSPVPKSVLKKILLAVGCLMAVYGLVLGDLWLRGREAFLQGEKYMRWHHDPEEKRASIEQEYEGWKKELDRYL
ncbi:MAG: hypothetical protein HY747_10985 [Elusimicrobia bacterium]|nr:hypothetical protein [Elusimicrobiota bacterium]